MLCRGKVADVRQRAAQAEAEAEKLEEQKRPFALKLKSSCGAKSPEPRIQRRQISEGLPALESERDRKFAALTKAGAGDTKCFLALVLHSWRVSLSLFEAPRPAWLQRRSE